MPRLRRRLRMLPVRFGALLLAVTLLIPTVLIEPVLAPSNDTWVASDGTVFELEKAQNEPSVAVNPVDNAIVVAGAKDWRTGTVDCVNNTPLSWPGFYRSLDGGQTWTNRLIRGGPAGPEARQGELGDFDEGGDPVVVFDGDGTPYYVGLVRRAQVSVKGDCRPPCNGCPSNTASWDQSLFVARYSFTRNDFDLIRIVQPGVSTTLIIDKPWINVDRGAQSPYRGRVYVCWTEIDSGHFSIRILYSDTRGQTWSSPVTLSTGSISQGCQIGVSPDGTVFVSWVSQEPDAERIRIAKGVLLLNGGVEWATLPPVTTITPDASCNARSTRLRAVGQVSLPSMAVDEALNGIIYIAWHDGRNASTDCADIFFVKSTNGGTTWTAPLKVVNDDPLLPGDTDGKRNDQVFPTISVSKGIVSIAFYDFRNSASGTMVDVYLAYSLDRGTNFMLNLRISDISSDPTIDSERVEDYITLVSLPSGTHDSLVQVVWTDTRDPPGTVPANQDVWTERLTLYSGGGSVARGSLITLSDATKNTVQNLQVGEQVLLVDVYTGFTYSATLTEIRPVYVDNLMTIHTEYGLPLRVDANRSLRLYVWTESGPVLRSVMELQPGDLLYNYDMAAWVRITDISIAYGGNHEFYDLLTDPFLSPDGHYLSFIANGYADPGESPCKLGPTP